MYAVYTSLIGMPLMISIDTHRLCIPEFETSNMADRLPRLPCCSWNIIRMFGIITTLKHVETCWTWYTVEHHHPLWFWESMIPGIQPVDWTNGMGWEYSWSRTFSTKKSPCLSWNLYPLWWLVGEFILTFTFAVMFRFLFYNCFNVYNVALLNLISIVSIGLYTFQLLLCSYLSLATSMSSSASQTLIMGRSHANLCHLFKGTPDPLMGPSKYQWNYFKVPRPKCPRVNLADWPHRKIEEQKKTSTSHNSNLFSTELLILLRLTWGSGFP